MIKQQPVLTLYVGHRGQASALEGGTWILLSARYLGFALGLTICLGSGNQGSDGTWILLSAGYLGFALGLTICLGSGNQGLGGTFSFFTLVSPVTVPTVALLLVGLGLRMGGPEAGKLLVGHEGDTGGCVVRSKPR